jgi:hypothetical protein
MIGYPNTGFQVGETQVFPDGTYCDQYRIGGTSLSSPLLAGVIAVADQFAHRSLGFVNPLYYKLLGTPALHDITAPATRWRRYARTSSTASTPRTGCGTGCRRSTCRPPPSTAHPGTTTRPASVPPTGCGSSSAWRSPGTPAATRRGAARPGNRSGRAASGYSTQPCRRADCVSRSRISTIWLAVMPGAQDSSVSVTSRA